LKRATAAAIRHSLPARQKISFAVQKEGETGTMVGRVAGFFIHQVVATAVFWQFCHACLPALPYICGPTPNPLKGAKPRWD